MSKWKNRTKDWLKEYKHKKRDPSKKKGLVGRPPKKDD